MTQPASPPGPPWGPPPTPPRPGRGTTAIVVTVVLALVVGVVALALAGWAAWIAFGGSDNSSTATPRPVRESSPAAAPGAPAGLARFYGQKLDWRPCANRECAILTVPLDYAHPEGSTIRLAVLRVPAADPSHRVGQLVVNPGGPGASGVQYAAAGSVAFGKELTRYYDIVGFDPRGVGQSTPLKCLDTSGLDQVMGADPDPETKAEADRLDQLTRQMGDACLSNTGELARHMSTVEAAKDMDVLRAALGQHKLDYLGASYGTFLGATYADLFPHHVGRMVLDGAIDPSLSNQQLILGQAQGFQTALRAYLADCVSKPGCPLGTSVGQAQARLKQFFVDVDRTPLPTGTARPLTEGRAMPGVWLPLYVKSYWPRLTTALRAAIDQGNGGPLLQLSDQYTERGQNGYLDNSMEALVAVNCLDDDESIPSNQVPSHFAQFDKVSPVFGRAFAYSLSSCGAWPIHSGHTSKALHAAGAPPIVVVGTTRDPATPYAWAKALAKELDSGVLVSRNGDGHTGFRQGNPCVDGAVEGYLISGKVPKNGLSC